MDIVLLVCEIFIALFGVFSVIIADNTHERLHGLFVIGLALEGFLAHALPSGHLVTAIVLIVLTVIAFLMIILSFHSLIEHLRRYFHHSKNPNVVPKHMALTIDNKDNDDAKYNDLHELIHEKHDLIHAKIDKLEVLLLEREKELESREKAIRQREMELGIVKEESAEAGENQ